MIITILDKLTKNDLIKVIANMWDATTYVGRGFDEKDKAIFEKIANACTEHCKQTGDWELPKV